MSPSPAAAVVRPERADDHEAVRAVIAAAFDGNAPGEGRRAADLDQALRSARCGRDGLGLVAEVGSSVVGHVRVTRGWVDAPVRLVDVGVLSPLSVLPGHQGRGIGGLLVRRVVDAAAGAGLPLVFLEGSPHYYGRLGFVAGRTMGFASPSVRIPDAGFQVRPTPSYEPWMTGRLVYPDVFWEHDCVGLRG